MAGKFLISLVLSAFFTISCSPYKILTKDFLSSKASIDYIHTTPRLSKNLPNELIYVAQPTVSASLPEVSEIKKVANEVVPLLIFNQWNHQYYCTLGKKEIKEDLASFLKASLMEEGKRRGFQFGDKAADQPLQLEISIESVSASGPYVNSGFFAYFVFFWISQTVEKAGPGIAESRFHFKLKKKGEVLLEESVVSSVTFEPLDGQRMSFSQLHMAFRSSLAELLGNTFEKNIDKILKKVELTLIKS